MSRSIIVYTPNPVEAARHSRALRQHFGLEKEILDWNGSSAFPGTGTLVITSNADPRIAARGNYYTLPQALKKLGEVFA